MFASIANSTLNLINQLALALEILIYWLVWEVAKFGDALSISKFQRQSSDRMKHSSETASFLI